MYKYTSNGVEYTTAALSSDPDIERVVSITPITSNSLIDNIGSVSSSTTVSSSLSSISYKRTLATLGVDSENTVPLPSIQTYISDKNPLVNIDESASGGGTFTDEQGISWSSISAVKATVDGKESINLNDGTRYLETPSRLTIGQSYTHFYIWWPRVSTSNWRTLFRGDNDHAVIIQTGTNDLGMYSNRNGAFRDTGYDIIPGQWQTLIVVGQGDSATATTGTQTYYVNGVNVGTTDRVISGTNTYRLSWTDGQTPGYFISAGIFNTALDSTQVAEFEAILQNRLVGNENVIGYTPVWNNNTTILYTGYNGNLNTADFSVTRTPNIPQITQIKSIGDPVITTLFTKKIVANRSIKSVELGDPNFSFEEYAKQDDDFDITFRSTHKTIFSNVTGGSGGGTVVVESGPTQTWY